MQTMRTADITTILATTVSAVVVAAIVLLVVVASLGLGTNEVGGAGLLPPPTIFEATR